MPSLAKDILAAMVFGLTAVLGSHSYSYYNVLYNSRNGSVISGGLYFSP